MTREEQIKEAAQKEMSKYPNFCITAPAFRMGAEWADEHPHWISVEEELPKPNSGMVVVVDYMGHLDFMKYCKSGWHNNKRWCVPKGIITHWCHLPQAPTEGIKGNQGETSPNEKGGEL